MQWLASITYIENQPFGVMLRSNNDSGSVVDLRHKRIGLEPIRNFVCEA